MNGDRLFGKRGREIHLKELSLYFQAIVRPIAYYYVPMQPLLQLLASLSVPRPVTELIIII